MFLVEKIDKALKVFEKEGGSMKEQTSVLIELLNKDVQEKKLKPNEKDALEYTVHYAKEALQSIGSVRVALEHSKIFAEKFNSLTK